MASQLRYAGSVQMGYVKALFESRRWYDLVPDQTHTVVTAGYGTFSDSDCVGNSDYVTAARTPDGALVMAYTPVIKTLTVDMTKLRRPPWRAGTYPANGTYTLNGGIALQQYGVAAVFASGEQQRWKRRLGPGAGGAGDTAQSGHAGLQPNRIGTQRNQHLHGHPDRGRPSQQAAAPLSRCSAITHSSPRHPRSP